MKLAVFGVGVATLLIDFFSISAISASLPSGAAPCYALISHDYRYVALECKIFTLAKPLRFNKPSIT